MPVTYYREDMVLELKQELATAEDDLKAEFAAHGKTLERLHRTEERLSRIEAKIKAFADDIASEPLPMFRLAEAIRAMLAEDTSHPAVAGEQRKDGAE